MIGDWVVTAVGVAVGILCGVGAGMVLIGVLVGLRAIDRFNIGPRTSAVLGLVLVTLIIVGASLGASAADEWQRLRSN